MPMLGNMQKRETLALDKVYALLEPREHWMKHEFSDRVGAHCLIGAICEVVSDVPLREQTLRTIRSVLPPRFRGSLLLFNDNPKTCHKDVLRVIRRAREKVVAS